MNYTEALEWHLRLHYHIKLIANYNAKSNTLAPIHSSTTLATNCVDFTSLRMPIPPYPCNQEIYMCFVRPIDCNVKSPTTPTINFLVTGAGRSK